jgi:hypothetical protein
MGVNLFLFGVVQIGLEPWRRKRLVSGFEEKVREVVLQQQPLNVYEIERNGILDGQVRMVDGTEGEDSPYAHGEQGTLKDMSTAEREVEDIIVQDLRDDVDGEIERKDIWISAVGGAVAGSFCTAVATYLLSR